MGMPSVNVSFSEKAAQVVKRGERGVVALILKEQTVPETNPIVVLNKGDINSTLSVENQKQIELALMGYIHAPKKVIAYIVKEEETMDYAEAFAYFSVNRFDYLAVPSVETDGKTAEVVAWIKEQRAEKRKVKAVLPNVDADNEGIIHVATKEFKQEDATYTTEQYSGRIAGLIAGTPLTISCTYAPLGELVDCSRLTKTQMDDSVDAGKFIVFFDGEKVKVGRGINSLTTVSEGKENQFKKIKIVDTMDMIFEDITKTTEDNYIGKFSNSYDNKCLLISAIGRYFEQLILDGVLSKGSVEIDLLSQRAYLKAKGLATDDMSDDEIKVADTDDKVFLKATIKILDAMEEINLPINI